jgi:hypothetical protein
VHDFREKAIQANFLIVCCSQEIQVNPLQRVALVHTHFVEPVALGPHAVALQVAAVADAVAGAAVADAVVGKSALAAEVVVQLDAQRNGMRLLLDSKKMSE